MTHDIDTLETAMLWQMRDRGRYDRDDYDRARMIGQACVDLAEFGIVYIDSQDVAEAVCEAANKAGGRRYVMHGRPGYWVVEQARGGVVG